MNQNFSNCSQAHWQGSPSPSRHTPHCWLWCWYFQTFLLWQPLPEVWGQACRWLPWGRRRWRAGQLPQNTAVVIERNCLGNLPAHQDPWIDVLEIWITQVHFRRRDHGHRFILLNEPWLYPQKLFVFSTNSNRFLTKNISDRVDKARFQKKKLKKLVEFSTKGLTPTPVSGKKMKCKILSITQFSENFEEQIIICHILKDMTIEIK